MPFSLPTVPINDLSRRFVPGSELLSSVSELIVNGPYLNSKYTCAFESEFAKFVGVEHCITVASGTSALELSIKALDLPADSVILVTANAGGYSTIAARNAGFRVKYVEVDDFGLLDLNELDRNLEGASAIIITHLYGQVCDMNALICFASQNRLRVIEDCAQAVGSKFGLIPVGSFGDIAAFSF
jgi:dTDP-4-amino-4,6-dideoxygalactose transaminase